jgi:hypothetical protein
MLSRLLALLPPPETPTLLPVDWPGVEARLGVPLPQDYKALIETFGLGQIDGYLSVLHPSTKNRHVNLEKRGATSLDALRWLRAGPERSPYPTYPEPVAVKLPYPIFPEPGGLLPWGITDNGDECFWRVADADPNRWTVVAANVRNDDWEAYRGGMVDFLCATLSRTRLSEVFADDWPSESPRFAPYQDRVMPVSTRR